MQSFVFTMCVKKLVGTVKMLSKGYKVWDVGKVLEAFHFAEKQKFLFFFPPVGEASEYFREIGGLMFINDLAKSSVHCIVKEAALFTLGIIIESNGNKNNIFFYFWVLYGPLSLLLLGLTKWGYKIVS